MRCLTSWTDVDSHNYSLMIINDFTIIPNSLVQATIPKQVILQSGGSQPLYISNLGDLIHKSQSSDLASSSYRITFCNDQIKILFGNFYDSVRSYYGAGFYNMYGTSGNDPFVADGWDGAGPTIMDNYISIILDDENQRGYIVWDEYLTNHGTRDGHNIHIIGGLSGTVDIIYNTFLTPLYNNWQSVPSIRGKNGISLLSIIKSSAINSGDAVSRATADAFDRLEETTKISTLIQGISEETPIIYSDDVNYMSITPTANNTCTLKFYLHGNVIYTLTNVSVNAYLSFLIDETNGIMKPSIIYEDS